MSQLINVQKALLASKDTYNVISISTSHISNEDRIRLDVYSNDKTCNMIMNRDSGWFIKLYDDESANEAHGLSAPLTTLLNVCLNLGFRMIEFDSDATVYEALTCFDCTN
jgi:hypothetical protein